MVAEPDPRKERNEKMTATKDKLLLFILALVMAFTVFGIVSTTQVNAEESGEAAYTLTLSNTMDSDVTQDSSIKGTKVVKTFTLDDLNALADVTNQNYMFSRNGKTANVYRVYKGVKLETLIKAAVGEDADISAYAGLKFWDKADLSAYYSKLANFKDHMVNDTFYYGDAVYDADKGSIVFGEGTGVDPVLALDFGYATLDSAAAGKKADELEFTKDTQYNNRVFLGMLSTAEKGGFWSQSNSYGIDLISQKQTDIKDVEVSLDNNVYDGKEKTVTVKFNGETLKEDTDYKVAYKNNINAGTATATLTGLGWYTGTADKPFTIVKAKNTFEVKLVKKTQTAKSKKKTTIAAKKVFKVTQNVSKGTVTYKKTSGNGKITVSSAGKVTVKKGLKKGKTYKVNVTATSKATTNYEAATSNLVLKIKIK